MILILNILILILIFWYFIYLINGSYRYSLKFLQSRLVYFMFYNSPLLIPSDNFVVFCCHLTKLQFLNDTSYTLTVISTYFTIWITYNVDWSDMCIIIITLGIHISVDVSTNHYSFMYTYILVFHPLLIRLGVGRFSFD